MTTFPGKLVHASMATRLAFTKVAEQKAAPGKEVFSPKSPIPPARFVSGRERKLADLDDLVKVALLTSRGLRQAELEKLALSGAVIGGAAKAAKGLFKGLVKRAPKVQSLANKSSKAIRPAASPPPIPSAVQQVKPTTAAALPKSAYSGARKLKVQDKKFKIDRVQPEVAAPGSNWAPVPQSATPPPIPAAAGKKPALDLASAKAPIDKVDDVAAAADKGKKPKSLMRQLAVPALVAGTGYGLYKGIPAAVGIAERSAAMPRAYGGGLQQYQYGYTPGGQAQF